MHNLTQEEQAIAQQAIDNAEIVGNVRVIRTKHNHENQDDLTGYHVGFLLTEQIQTVPPDKIINTFINADCECMGAFEFYGTCTAFTVLNDKCEGWGGMHCENGASAWVAHVYKKHRQQLIDLIKDL